MATVHYEVLARRTGRHPATDGRPCPQLRARLLPHDLRSRRRRRSERHRLAGRLPHPLSALAFWDGVRAALEGLQLRPAKNLRIGDQQQSLLRLSDAVQRAGRPEAGDGPRVRALRLLQEQLLVQPDQSQDDGPDGQSRPSDPPLHRSLWHRRSGNIHRRLLEHRGPDRHPFAVHPPHGHATASPSICSRSPGLSTTTTKSPRPSRFDSKDYMDRFINPPELLGRIGRAQAAGRKRGPAIPQRTAAAT